jgi:hypothetical protein
MNKKDKKGDEYSSDFKDVCKGYTALPDTLSKRDRIIAIGDVHGDLHLTIKNLLLAKVIKVTDDTKNILQVTYEDETTEKYKWIGDDTVVVQVGDQVDRCRPVGLGKVCIVDEEATINDEHSDIKILDLFTELNKLAKKKKGMVISLLGNHELMNYQGNINYVSYKGVHNSDFQDMDNKKQKKEFRKNDGSSFTDGTEGRKFAFREKINETLACTRQSAIIVGSFIFVHGGIVPELAKQYKVGKVNSVIRKWLLKKISDNDSDVETLLNSPKESPFWTRLFGHLPTGLKADDSRCKESISEVLKLWGSDKEGLKGMIVGHTPQIENGINSTCDDKVWRVDIGASQAFDVFDKIKNSGRKPSVLEIVKDGREFNILS